jgi:hypothetical protein
MGYTRRCAWKKTVNAAEDFRPRLFLYLDPVNSRQLRELALSMLQLHIDH